MKPQHIIAVVVIAVLATVVIEETRISKMRAVIIGLRAIPRDELSNTGADKNPIVEKALSPEPSETPPTPEPAPVPEPPTSSANPAAGPQIPEGFPEPDEAKVKELAMSAYSDFAYEIGLNNRERAYLDVLLNQRSAAIRDNVGKWIAATPADRSTLDDARTLLIVQSDEAISTFLANEAAYQAFKTYHAMQPEREILTALSSALDSAGATLEIEKEKQLIEALYQARVGTGSLDWNSPAALSAIAGDQALEQFENEWKQQSAALAALLPKFLSESQTAAVLQSREARKAEMTASIESAVEAINGGSE